ncbi:hypothetical protein [Mycolicibacterium fluoranthenivorans]|jgi:hypothetical protein|nr:hypothetical protein [Mycolicibacterium fluoranthenivorans]
MTKNGVTEMIDTKDAGAVVDAGRRRIRRLLFAALAALAVTATALVLVATPPQSSQQSAPVCLVFGPGPVNNGKAVIAAGVTMDVPEEAIVAGLTAAMQETELLNLANPNVPDSLVAASDGLGVDQQGVGILQQTAAWGSAGDRMSPAAAAAKFFTSMRDVDGWEAMPAAELAGIVQRSAWPDTYLDEVPAARQFYRAHLGEVLATHCPSREAVLGAHS